MSFFSRFFSKKPNAANAYKQAGGNAQHAFWLFAAPVHLQLGRESYFLASPAPLLAPGPAPECLNRGADAEAIILSLNQHFAGFGYHFYLQNDVWFLGLDADPKISTTPIAKVINKDIAPYLMKGENALAWAKFQNEIQMLLFAHPVNEAREARGELPINSLWFYGLSTM